MQSFIVTIVAMLAATGVAVPINAPRQLGGLGGATAPLTTVLQEVGKQVPPTVNQVQGALGQDPKKDAAKPVPTPIKASATPAKATPTPAKATPTKAIRSSMASPSSMAATPSIPAPAKATPSMIQAVKATGNPNEPVKAVPVKESQPVKPVAQAAPAPKNDPLSTLTSLLGALPLPI
ncbi:hypothetical protein F4777DRAFT_584815 [Nemania sp. FL0916]|nr:hypothetical protein F4777DRAFT_584815 [Nemania sp. FL0916]